MERKENNHPEFEKLVHHILMSDLSDYMFADELNAAVSEGFVEASGEEDKLISLPDLLKWLDYQYLLLHEDEIPF